jgi:Ulp1 family protease
MNFAVRDRRDCLQQSPKVKRDHFFTTDFYEKLTRERVGYCYPNVQRWTKQINWKEIDHLFIPICKPNHFVLISVEFAAKSICYYDSLLDEDIHDHDEGLTMCRHILKWVHDEFLRKLNDHIDVNSWRLKVVRDAPQQSNDFDCGMFVCKYADYLSSGCSLTFDQSLFPYFRKRMLIEIAAGTLLL